MSRIVFINNTFCPEEDAKISIFDRGVLFADAVYEVVGVLDGKLIDFQSHMRRLDRSLREVRIRAPLSGDDILKIFRTLVDKNAVDEGLVYLQISRGVADRDFVFPKNATPGVFAFTQNKPSTEKFAARDGIELATVPDLRWVRRDIKTVGLLAQVLAKQMAKESGADEALMVKDDYVTEGGATSFYIIKDGAIITRPLSTDILPGVTRQSLIKLARDNGTQILEQPFTVKAAYEADEAFITGASTYVCPVIAIDGHTIGSGIPGPMVQRLMKIYMTFARQSAV